MAVTGRKDQQARRGTSFCLFHRGGREFALPSASTGQILTGLVSHASASEVHWLLGVVEQPESALPLIGLDTWFGEIPRPHETTDQVVVMRVGDEWAGLAVDRVREVRVIEDAAITSPPPEMSVIVRGIWNRDDTSVLILDPDALMSQLLSAREQVPGWRSVPKLEMLPRRVAGAEDFCMFVRGGRELAMTISAARELLSGETLTPVPQPPPHLLGVFNLRGDLLPVVRIDEWLGLPEKPFAPSDVIVVVHHEGVLLGVLADRVRDVRSVDLGEVEPLAEGENPRGLFRGLWKAAGISVNILDPKRLIETAIEQSRIFFERSYRAPGMIAGAVPGSSASM